MTKLPPARRRTPIEIMLKEPILSIEAVEEDDEELTLPGDLDRADVELAAGKTVSLAEVVEVLYEICDDEIGDYIAARFGGDS